MQPGEREILENLRQRLAEARRESDSAKETLVKAQQRASYWEKRTTGLAKAVAGLEEAEVEPAAPPQSREPEAAEPARATEPLSPSGDAPRGREAVLLILQERPDTWLTVREIARIAHQRGWITDASKSVEAIRIALKRAAQAGEIDQGTQDGRMLAYRLPRHDSPSTNGARPSEEVVHEEGLGVGR